MKITTGKIQSAQKIIIYGPEGIGKSTFAAQFPNAVFIDTEGSTKHMDVARLPNPSSWSMLLEEVKHIKLNPSLCKTLVIDTADWAEQLCANEVCSKAKKDSIEDFGYGKGYSLLTEEFGRLLNLLTELIDLGINVVLTAHAKMRKFEQPDEMGSYDRWEMKLQKNTAPLVKEWADMVLFANYKTFVVKTEDKKNKAQGGNRVMYTAHHACWDAKNRHDLREEISFEYAQIAHCIPAVTPTITPTVIITPITAPVVEPVITPTSEPQQQIQPQLDLPKTDDLSTGIPKALADLMKLNNVTVEEIQKATASRGYYPLDTPIENYESEFVNGVLVGAWPQVFKMIQDLRTIPF